MRIPPAAAALILTLTLAWYPTFVRETTDVGAAMTWEESLYANYTDGMLILHRGRIVYERYLGCLEEDGKHAAMSMTKSVTGLLAEILIAEGVLDDSLRVRDIVPEIGDSAFATAKVRQVMDMTTGVRYSEDYRDPDADICLYSRAASPLPKPKGYADPDGYWAYLQQVEANGVHGQTIYVDPAAEMVIVRLASYPQAQNGFIDPTSLPAYEAVADYFEAKTRATNGPRATRSEQNALKGPWRVTELVGAAVIEASDLELRFAANGQIFGNASCNRFTGTYSIQAAALTLGDRIYETLDTVRDEVASLRTPA